MVERGWHFFLKILTEILNIYFGAVQNNKRDFKVKRHFSINHSVWFCCKGVGNQDVRMAAER